VKEASERHPRQKASQRHDYQNLKQKRLVMREGGTGRRFAMCDEVTMRLIGLSPLGAL
jgi:hypothetical protein